MKICVYGEAGHFGYVTQAMKVDGSLTVSGISSDRGSEQLKKSFPSAKSYATLHEMLDAENPGLLAVTPEFDKTADAILEGLKRGIPVYADKPLALTLYKLEELKAVQKQTGTPLGAMFGITEESWFKTLKTAVDAGEIGEVRLMHGQKSYKLGQRPDFYKDRRTFGGLIPWVAIHAIDWVLTFGDTVERISASSSSLYNRNHGDLEVSSAVLMQFENGAIGTVTADYFRPTGSERHDDDRLRLTGTRGMIEAIGQKVYLENEEKRRELPLLAEGSCVLSFIEMLQKKTWEKETERAFYATEIALLAREADDRHTTLSYNK